jgi:hypothetical protein
MFAARPSFPLMLQCGLRHAVLKLDRTGFELSRILEKLYCNAEGCSANVDTRALPIGTVPYHAAYASYNGGEEFWRSRYVKILKSYCNP